MHAGGDWQAMDGVLSKDMATVCIPPDLEAEAQNYKNGVRSVARQQQRKLNVSQTSTKTTKLCPNVSSQILRSYVGQVTHISPTTGVFKPNATVMCKCSAFKGTPNNQL